MSLMAKGITTTLLCLVVFTSSISAQHQYATSEDSDPAATALLDLMDQFLTSMTGIHAVFEMDISIPGEDAIKNEGAFDQEGSKYIIELDSYKIISDGEVRWVYFADENEVNIYNVATDRAPSTPIDFLQLYRSQEFVYRIAPEETEYDETAIEFKPLDKYSDYVKVRLTLKKDTGSPVRVELFEKGGGRTDLRIADIYEAKNFPRDHFVFNPAAYPDIHVEDLRID
jgi:outer membrane lipoprotein-sorting protein